MVSDRRFRRRYPEEAFGGEGEDEDGRPPPEDCGRRKEDEEEEDVEIRDKKRNDED